MVPINQRRINEGIAKVAGSSNRGFITLDPERQPRAVTQALNSTPANGKGGGFRAQQERPCTAESNSDRR